MDETAMINFEALRKARERMDDSKDGQFGRCGNWKIALGGYDHGYEVYYKNYPVMRVNYELNEYEFYSCDYADAMFTQDTIPQIKKVLEITPRFDNVGDIDDSGDYIDNFGYYVNGVEANVSEGNKMKFKKIMTKEAKSPVMWAIDFRDMHSAIHGLYYSKDRKVVEEFYEALKLVLDPEYTDDLDLRETDLQTILDEFYFRGIREIDEINFRDIGKLPSGKYGIIVDDVEYRLVNNVAIDLYEESKKVVKEASIPDDADIGEPAVYVGTYAKYNNGSLDGEWVTITDFDTYEEFMDYIRKLHSDEKDPEFMFQDYENFPRRWYSESGLDEETFYKIKELGELSGEEREAFAAYLDADIGDDDVESFRERYEGKFNSPTDLAYHLIDEFGFDGIGNLDYYFDYDAFGRDLMFDFHTGDEGEKDAEGEPQDPDHYYDQDGYDMGEYESDRQVGEDWVENMGGVDQLGKETAQNYFDYEAFGRDLMMTDYYEEDGYYFHH